MTQASLAPDWQHFLTQQGATFVASTTGGDAACEIASFGDPAGELLAAAGGSIVVPLAHLGLIDCAGEDAKSFLHNQLTNDINHLAPSRAQLAAWCTAKGRMIASFFVWQGDAGYRLALASELVAPVQKRLQMFVLRSQVTLTDRSHEIALLGLAGPQAAAALVAAGLPLPAAVLDTASAGATQVLRLAEQRFIVAIPVTAAPALWPQLTATLRPAGTPAWRWLDIAAGLPLITGATREEFVPQMADFDKLGGVSFHKGCYPGQEIVARTQYLGKVKRHLFRIASALPLAAGTSLHSPENPDQSIGMIATAAPAPTGGYAGLAVIQSNFAASARLGAIDGPAIQASAVNPLAEG